MILEIIVLICFHFFKTFDRPITQEKIVTFVAQYPAIDRPLTTISQKVGVEKAYIALTFAVIPLLIMTLLGSGHFLM